MTPLRRERIAAGASVLRHRVVAARAKHTGQSPERFEALLRALEGVLIALQPTAPRGLH
jgi:hypothetical protein